tara:strand:+ start:799 stop:1248 length:450 start_codon:yes stop_codon:yes gene_type:complete
MLDRISIKITDANLPGLPKYATKDSAGIDLRASLKEPLLIDAGKTELIKTGIAIYIGDPEYAGIILPRSGLGHKHGIVLGNLLGLIDSDYQGELMVSCWNRSELTYTIQPYDRIAQLIFIKINQPEFEVVKEFKKTDRGEGGFGSSGKR